MPLAPPNLICIITQQVYLWDDKSPDFYISSLSSKEE